METLRLEPHALREEIETLERRWLDAAVAGNAPALRQLLSDHVVAVTFDGVTRRGRNAVLEKVIDTNAALLDVEIEQFDVRPLGPGVVLVTGQAVLHAPAEGERPGGLVHYTRVWQQRNGRWGLVAAHTSRLSS